MRKFMVPAAVGLAVMVLVAAAGWAFFGDRGSPGDVVATPTGSASPSVSAPGPLPTPSPAPSGFLPVDSIGAEHIPWDEVGPGWFLVDWAEQDTVWGEGEEGWPTLVSPADASVSLLSPSGAWYTAGSLNETGADETVGWLGNEVAVFRTTDPGFTGNLGDVLLLNLRTGASRQVLSGAWDLQLALFVADGTLASTGAFDEETLGVAWYDAQMREHRVCAGAGSEPVAPDGSRVVCLGWVLNPGTGDQTEILLGTIGSDVAAQVIDTFRLDPYAYDIRGWLDPDTFLVSRQDPAGVAPETFYTYNIVTRKVADFPLPFGASGRVYFDWGTQTYADVSAHAVDFYRADGTLIVDVSCAGSPYWYGHGYSGTRVLAMCGEDAEEPSSRAITFTLINLEDGSATQVADVVAGPDQSLRAVYPYVGNLD